MLGLKIFLGVMIALMLLGIIGARTKCSKSIAGAITICCIVLLTAIVAKENQPKVTEVAPESGNDYRYRRYRGYERIPGLHTYFRHVPV